MPIHGRFNQSYLVRSTDYPKPIDIGAGSMQLRTDKLRMELTGNDTSYYAGFVEAL